jgi:protein-export membrane protein SecD
VVALAAIATSSRLAPAGLFRFTLRVRHRTVAALALAGAAVACAGLGVLRAVDASGEMRPGLRLVYDVDREGADEPARAVEQAVQVIRARLDGLRSGSGRPLDIAVHGTDSQIVIDVVGLDPADEKTDFTMRMLIARTAKLQLQLVVFGSEGMRRIFDATKQDPGPAAALGIAADVDSWTGPDGATWIDSYLRAEDREELLDEPAARRIGCRTPALDGRRRCVVPGRRSLEQYLAAAAAADPALRVADSEEVAYERVDGTASQPGYWRTYVLERAVSVDGKSVTDASVTTEPSTGRPVVIATLEPDAARAFAELTRANTGRKLAIVVDGRVQSAPVISAAIPGGRIQIELGRGDLEDLQRDAGELATALRAGALPTALAEASRASYTRAAAGFLEAARTYLVVAGGLLAALVVMLLLTRKSQVAQGT